MERSFARGTRYGFDHARWRGRWRMLIQEYLTAAIQNIEVLIRHGGHSRRSMAKMLMKLGKLSTAMAHGLRHGLLLCRVFFGSGHAGAISAHA